MKCEMCKNQIELKTFKVKELGIEVTKKQEQNGLNFKDIKIPKGFRLIKATEMMRFWDNKTFRDTLMKNNNNDLWFFIENLIIYKKKSVARFFAYSVSADLFCGRNPGCSDPGLGVVFVKEIKSGGENGKEK